MYKTTLKKGENTIELNPDETLQLWGRLDALIREEEKREQQNFGLYKKETTYYEMWLEHFDTDILTYTVNIDDFPSKRY